MSAPDAGALDRVRRFTGAVQGEHVAGMSMEGEMFALSIDDLKTVLRMASEGVR